VEPGLTGEQFALLVQNFLGVTCLVRWTENHFIISPVRGSDIAARTKFGNELVQKGKAMPTMKGPNQLKAVLFEMRKEAHNRAPRGKPQARLQYHSTGHPTPEERQEDIKRLKSRTDSVLYKVRQAAERERRRVAKAARKAAENLTNGPDGPIEV
jgi:hypothetical protein